MKSSRRVLSTLLAAAALFAAPATFPQAWPDKPIRIITSSGPGGTLDIAARMFADLAAQSLGQSVVVDSRPGASGMIATQAVARAPADGYTILFINGAIVQNEILQPAKQYKLSELMPLGLIAKMPIAFSVNTGTKANTLGEWVQMARANPKDFSWGSFGRGSSGHVLGAVLQQSARLDATHIPYNGEGPVMTAMLGGVVSAAFGSPGLYAAQEQTGRVKVVAITSPHPSVPNVPTFAQAGYPEIKTEGILCAFLPAGTPPAVVERLSRELIRVFNDPKVREKIVAAGGRVTPMNPQEFADFLKEDLQNWGAAIHQANITLQ